MRCLFVAALMVLFGSVALAQEKKPPPPLTYEQAGAVLIGLQGLDHGSETTVKDGSVDHVVHHAFVMDDTLRGRLGLAEARLLEARKTYSFAYNDLVRKYAEGADKVPPARMAAFETAVKELDRSSSGVTVPHIVLEDLKLKQNPDIGIGIIAALDPIIDRD